MTQKIRKRAVKGDTYYGKAATQYEARRTNQGWWHVEHEQMIACLSTLPDALDVLDVPFGTGRFLPIYLERGDNVHGLDSSADMIEQARHLRGDSFGQCEAVVGSAMALPFDDNSFDVVVSVRFLSEIITFADAKLALSEFARVSRSHAILEFGETSDGRGQIPAEGAAMRDLMEAGQVDELLHDHGFEAVERHLVRSDNDGHSKINLIHCKVT